MEVATSISQEGLRATMGAIQKEMGATIRDCQEKMEAVVNAIQYEFEDTINKRVEGILPLLTSRPRAPTRNSTLRFKRHD
jgi:hypothetical protein